MNGHPQGTNWMSCGLDWCQAGPSSFRENQPQQAPSAIDKEAQLMSRATEEEAQPAPLAKEEEASSAPPATEKEGQPAPLVKQEEAQQRHRQSFPTAKITHGQRRRQQRNQHHKQQHHSESASLVTDVHGAFIDPGGVLLRRDG